MKLSDYTVRFDDAVAGETIWFNTLNGALAYTAADFDAKGELNLLAQMGFALDAPSEHNEHDEHGGFDSTDAPADTTAPDAQTALLESIYHQDQDDTSTLSLCIAPSYACNLACPYCYEQPDNTPANSKPMVAQTQDAIVQFVRSYHDRSPFSELKVQWYGGEPILALDIIESLSARFLEFAQAEQIAYSAGVLSNATLIDADVAARLAAIKVEFAMPTLDGIGANHDRRRPAKNGEPTYEQVFASLFTLADAGIKVGCNLNLDRNNYDDYVQLREVLAPYPDVNIFASHLRDYNGKFANGSYDRELFDPYASRAEYARALFELYRMMHPNRAGLCQSLQPAHLFCQGQLKNYFVIDALGGIYTCDGYMGDKNRRIASVLDPLNDIADVEALRAATTYSPFADPLCASCAVLPQCKGECGWERGMFAENCHALKYTLELYVKAYRATFANRGQRFEQLVAPLDPTKVLSNRGNVLG